MDGLSSRGRSLWRGLFRRSAIEAEMVEEFWLHLELRAEELVRQGIPRREAERQARLEFGSMEVHLIAHLGGDRSGVEGRIREMAALVDPRLSLYDFQPLDDTLAPDAALFGFWIRLIGVVSAIALLLALAGIYAVTSFAVTRRTREIGVRLALGARQRQVLASVLGRPTRQIATGMLAGGIIVALLEIVTESSDGASLHALSLVAAYSALMMGVCLLSCVVPTRRVLAVEPTEALRADR